jgi:hypothetical protein
MLSPFRFAGIVTVIFAVSGPAWAEAVAPPALGVTIDKVVIDNGLSHTVKYFVKGGSPRLQALVRRVEWTENELSVVEQLQLLKLDTVVNERRVAAFRTAQLTNPYHLPGYFPLPIDPYCPPGYQGNGTSPLQKALQYQLAYEATPDSAMQLIGFLEQMQTELDAELKALPAAEQKAVQGPIDALRPRVAALAGGEKPPPRPQPVAPKAPAARPAAVPPKAPAAGPAAVPQLRVPAPAVPQQIPMPLDPIAYKQIEVEWGNSWWPAAILGVQGNKYLIHYTGFDASWDEWVGKDRIRPANQSLRTQNIPWPPPVVTSPVAMRQVTFPPSAVPQQLPMPFDPVAFEQTVRQNQERVRQQIMQAQLRVIQRR